MKSKSVNHRASITQKHSTWNSSWGNALTKSLTSVQYIIWSAAEKSSTVASTVFSNGICELPCAVSSDMPRIEPVSAATEKSRKAFGTIHSSMLGASSSPVGQWHRDPCFKKSHVKKFTWRAAQLASGGVAIYLAKLTFDSGGNSRSATTWKKFFFRKIRGKIVKQKTEKALIRKTASFKFLI